MHRKALPVIGFLLILAVVLVPCLAQPPTVTGAHVRVEYPSSLEQHARHIAQICDAAWQAYADLYGLPLPETIQVKITLDPKQRLRLFTDGKDTIFFQLADERQLLPPTQGGPHNVYGFCHEMGHIVFYHRMKNTTGMPEGVGEGWAHYFGSVVVSHVYEKLGEKVWTPPHNYHESSGLPRLLRQVQTEERLRHDPTARGAKVLYDVERKFGKKGLGQVANKMPAQQPTGKELVPKFVAALVEVTGDASAARLVPQSSCNRACAGARGTATSLTRTSIAAYWWRRRTDSPVCATTTARWRASAAWQAADMPSSSADPKANGS